MTIAVTTTCDFFPSRSAAAEASTQSDLRLPGNLTNWVCDFRHACPHLDADAGGPAIAPGGFEQHLACEAIARLGDGTAPDGCSTRPLARHPPEICHQLSGSLEPANIADFRHQRHRRYQRNAA